MIQKVKILGVALAVATTLGAVTASAASAVTHHFNGAAGDTVTAVSLTPYIYEHTTGEGKNNGCKNVTMKGELAGETQTSLTLTPTFSECVVEEGGKPKGSMIFLPNNCDFLITGETTSGNPTGGEHADLHLQCPEGKSIETRISAFQLKCSKIEPQVFDRAVRYENATTEGGKSHIRAAITAHGGSSSTEGVCGEGTHNNSLLTSELTLSAPSGISISTT